MMTPLFQPRDCQRFISNRCKSKGYYSQTNWLWLCIVLLCGPAFTSTPLQAQPAGNASQLQENDTASSSGSKPQFQRVFVPEDQVGKLVPRDYMPVAVNDLESLLEKFETGEGLDWENQPKVTRAIYTARLLGDQLLSDFNYWEIQYQDDISGYLPIKPWNLAITNPATNPNRESLSWAEAAQWYVDANGHMWLPIQDSSPLWFGWKGVTSESTNHSRSFTFQVPATTRNQMVLLLDNAIEVRCPDAVVRPTSLEELALQLDIVSKPLLLQALSNWYARQDNGNASLWLIDFNGGNRLALTFQAKQTNPHENRQALVSSMLQQYRINENGIDLLTRIAMTGPLTEPHLYLDFGSNLKIRDIKLGDQILQWSTTGRDSAKIKVDLTGITESNRLSQLQVTSFISQEQWKSETLPDIRVSNAIVLKGDTVLECRPAVVPLQVRGYGCEALSTADSGTSSESNLRLWQWRWSGNPPRIEVRSSLLPRRINANSLTRINVIKGSLNATTWVRLSPQIKTGGEARFQLGEGWILDSVTAATGSSLKIDDSGLPDGREILLRWDKYIDDEQLTFELQAHRAIETDAAEIALPDAPFLELKEGQLTGVVAVETTGRYLVKPTPEMLTLLYDEQQLSPWQQAKLPRFSSSWLLQTQEGRLPELIFTSEPSTFTGKWEVFVRPESEGITEEYRLQFRPLFGSMDRVLVRLRNSHPQELLWQWDDSGKTYLLQATRQVTESGSESYVVILPRPVNEPFAITAKRNVGAQQWNQVPLPTSDQATSEELVVHISKLLNSRLPEAGWISVIPADTEATPDFAMYRAESSLADSITVARQDPSATKKVWAIKGHHDIRCFSDGTILHETEWSIANGRSELLQIAIPPKSQWIDVRFEGISLPYSLDPKNQHSATITLPSSNDNGRLTLVFTETVAPFSFRNQLPIRRASLDCGVVEYSETLHTPSLYSLIRFQDFPALYGSNPLQQLSGILNAFLFWDEDRTNAFAVTTPIGLANRDDEGYSRFDNVVQWNRFVLSDAPPVAQENMAVILWDTRFLRNTILMYALTIGALAVWGWFRTPKLMCGLSLVLLAMSTSFADFASLAATYTLLMFAIAWLVMLGRLAGRSLTGKTHYSGSVQSHNTLTRKALPLIGLAAFLSGIAHGSTAHAQDSSAGTYGILIPFDKEGEIKGNYVYMPIEAYQFLTNPGGKSYVPRTPYMIRQVGYQFRATEGVAMTENASFQLIADYEIEVIDPSVAVRWPIGSGRAVLERLVVNQFEIIPGFTVRQDDLAILWYPDRSGLFKLRLQLRPIPTSGELDQFDIPIPLVPTGSLSVIAPSSKRVKVNGNSLELVNGVPATYSLGEQNRLSISVLDKEELFDETEPLDSDVDAWIHFQGDNVFLLTQIRMRYGDASIPKKINLQMSDLWEPIGLNWGDAKWDGLTTNSANGLTTYQLSLQSTSMTEAVVYTAWRIKQMLNLEENNLALFPDSAWVNPVQFSLTTSNSPDSLWSLEVPDEWTEDASTQALTRWDARGLGVPARTYVSSSRATLPKVEPREVITDVAISETCDTVVRSTHLDLTYEATWNRETSGTESLLFAVPEGLRIQSLSLNGSPRSDYRIVRSNSQSLLSLTHTNLSGTEGNKLTCQASLPLSLNTSYALPRITAAFGTTSQSFLRLHRETNLVMQLEDVEQLPDTRQMLERSTEEMLKSNQVGIMQVELAGHFTTLAQLPARISVTQPSSRILGNTLGLLISNNDRWRYTLITKLRSEDAPLDSLVFELPATVTSQMEISPPSPFRIDPSPDGAHQLLSLFPVTPITEAQVHTISFDLNRVSGQVSLPQVTLVGSGAVSHRLGLPQLSGQHNYTWRTTGLRPEPIPTDFEAIINSIDSAKSISFQFLEPSSRRYQADLQSDKSNSPKMSVNLVRHQIEIDNEAHALLKSTYWIDPEGFLTARFSIPEGMILVGAIQNGEPQAIQREPLTGIDSIAIQPSNLPTKLELILKSQGVKRWDDLKILFPIGINLEIERSLIELTSQDKQKSELANSLFRLNNELSSPVPAADAKQVEWNAILMLLNDAEATLATYGTGALSGWNAAWRTELEESRDQFEGNEVALRWLEKLTAASPPLSATDSTLRNNADSATTIRLLKNGTIHAIAVEAERQPLQIHVSNLFAAVLLIVGLCWLSFSGLKVSRIFDWLAQTPAIPLGITGFLLLIYPGHRPLGLVVLGLAAVSLVLQAYKRVIYRRTSPVTPTTSKRKIAT